ncbi:hypothetical protein ACRYCC_22400 [Actinomadura scrupuli]|uniref:hypothetical protein n=1 Tax=Actinomadura scrupuli TaxID=559629 RepID=UPI003D96D5F3
MTWQRLESTTVGTDLTEGLEARIADPLWLLGKQWQVGELTGEDAASPIVVEATVEHTPVTRVRIGTGPVGPVITREDAGLPLETAVERELVRDGPAAARIATEAALQLWRLLDSAGAPPAVPAGLRAAYPLTLPLDDGIDPVGRAQLELLARRAVDTEALLVAVTEAGNGAVPGLPADASPAVRRALRAWATWYGGLFSEPGPGPRAWNPERMEYGFQVAAGVGSQREVQLVAPEYTGGSLDWYSFDVAAGGLPMGTSGALTEHVLRIVPTPARFAGQAASRWWQVENRDVWFGDITTAPEDLARAAVAAYGTVTGDDWFLAPCRLPSGVLVRGRQVRVLDTFGEAHTIRSCAEQDGPARVWRFFELTGDTVAGDDLLRGPHEAAPDPGEPATHCPWLFLPPVLAGRTESRPIEEVALLRDEAANLGWAAELRVESASGRVVDRAALARAALPPTPGPSGDAWRYRLATPVPDHYVPLVPVRRADGGLSLRRGRLAVAVDGGEAATRGAIGTILEAGGPLSIHDEEILPTGVSVMRTWQMARTGDGGFVVWVGRRKTAGRPRRSPGLGFDEVITSP